MKIELPEEELDGCMTKEEYGEIWQYARLRTKEEMLGLLAFGELMDESREPVRSFASAMFLWLDRAQEVMRQNKEEELPDGPDTTRRVH